MRLFLVRHAEAAPGEPDDLRPLTPAGRDAAREGAARLAAERPDAVLSSPLLRARQTAAAYAAAPAGGDRRGRAGGERRGGAQGRGGPRRDGRRRRAPAGLLRDRPRADGPRGSVRPRRVPRGGPMSAVSVRGLRKSYGSTEAV